MPQRPAITLSQPDAGALVVVALGKGEDIILNFNTDIAMPGKAGDDLMFTFPDGGRIILKNFYSVYKDDLAFSFIIDGAELGVTEFFAMMGEVEIFSAAEGEGAIWAGGRSYDLATINLLPGVPHLGPLYATFSDTTPEILEDLVRGWEYDGGSPWGMLSLLPFLTTESGIAPQPVIMYEIQNQAPYPVMGMGTAAVVLFYMTPWGNFPLKVTLGKLVAENAVNIDDYTIKGEYGTVSITKSGIVLFTPDAAFVNKLAPGQEILEKLLFEGIGGGNDVEVSLKILGNNANDDHVYVSTVVDGAMQATNLFFPSSSLAGRPFEISSDGSIDFGLGNDLLQADAMAGGNVLMGADSDTVIIAGDMGGGTVDTGIDNDFVSLGSMSNGLVTTENGSDTVTIGNMNNGTVNTGFDNDSVTITNMTNGLVTTENGSDTVIVTGNMGGGTVNTGFDNDSVTITNMTNGFVTTENGSDTVIVTGNMGDGTIDTGFDNDSVSLGSMSGGLITTKEGSDTVRVDHMSNGVIDLGNDNDTAVLGSMTAGEVLGGSGSDTVTVSGNMGGGIIDLGADNDSASLGSMTGGRVMGGEAHDTITIAGGGMTGGSIYGDITGGFGSGRLGADIIAVSGGMNAGMVYGDVDTIESGGIGGDDTISIDTFAAGGIFGDAAVIESGGKGGNDSISIGTMINGNIYADAETFDLGAIGGNDSITVGVMRGGNIYSDDVAGTNTSGGDDTVIVNSIDQAPNVRIVTGYGDDGVYIDSIGNSTVTIDAGVGDDTVHIDSISDSIVNIDVGDGNDIIGIGDMINVPSITFEGGAGSDTLQFIGNPVTYNISTGDLNGSSVISLSSIENIIGSSGDDIITGFNGMRIFGGAGNDYIQAASGSNMLNGDAGNDTLVAGIGADTLTGGSGADFFSITPAALANTTNRIRITDFSITEGDRIDLRGLGVTLADVNYLDSGADRLVQVDNGLGYKDILVEGMAGVNLDAYILTT